MMFKILDNEIEETLDLINKVFKTDAKKENFHLLDNQKVLLLKDDKKVIGCSLITLKKDPVKDLLTYYIDYFCIDEAYQHQGLGKKLFEEIERLAIDENVSRLELTSNKKREVARQLYLNEGMNIIDTDLFMKDIK